MFRLMDDNKIFEMNENAKKNPVASFVKRKRSINVKIRMILTLDFLRFLNLLYLIIDLVVFVSEQFCHEPDWNVV